MVAVVVAAAASRGYDAAVWASSSGCRRCHFRFEIRRRRSSNSESEWSRDAATIAAEAAVAAAVAVDAAET